MALSPRVGRFKIEIERRWDIADLQELSDSLLQTYGLLYLGLEGGGDLPLRHSKFVIMPDDWNTFPWGHIFYRDVVPPKQRIKIKSFHYSSPGIDRGCRYIESAGVDGARSACVGARR